MPKLCECGDSYWYHTKKQRIFQCAVLIRHIRHIFGANQDIYKPDFVPDKSGGNHFSWHNIAVMLMRLPLFRHVNETNTVLRPARI